MKKIGALLTLFMIMGVASSWACPVYNWANEKASSNVYYVKAGGMLARGFVRIVESPVEIACSTYKGAHKDELKYGAGIIKGFGMGTLWMVDDVLRGGWDIITFAFPDYHGEPGEHQQDCWGSNTTAAAKT